VLGVYRNRADAEARREKLMRQSEEGELGDLFVGKDADADRIDLLVAQTEHDKDDPDDVSDPDDQGYEEDSEEEDGAQIA
jgi:hypothetical protein